ncbi:MAG TPA: TrmH family RNA methyltransferase [Fimbriimonadaceae bacterium]|nr:TrmH family RNA methyltransferase [Fimbriimonadaceae bacterium]
MNVGKAIISKTGARRLFDKIREEHPRRIEISFLLQDWEDAYNVGGMFRVADACGASQLFMSGRTPMPPDPQISVTSLGHHRRIPFEHFEKHDAAALHAKELGYQLVAVEVAEGAVLYSEFEWPDKVCLVLGNEVNGVYGSVMKHRDAAVFIPMYGKGRSMNVHVAAAVVAFRAVVG